MDIKGRTYTLAQLQDLFVEIIGDTMTGELIIDPSSVDTSLTAKKDIILKADQKLYFDG